MNIVFVSRDERGITGVFAHPQPGFGEEAVEATHPEVTAFLALKSGAPGKIYKSTIIRRLTEEEAVVLAALLEASPVKSKMLWQASEWLRSDDPLFGNLRAAIADALGPSRADEILAPER